MNAVWKIFERHVKRQDIRQSSGGEDCRMDCHEEKEWDDEWFQFRSFVVMDASHRKNGHASFE
jgi:hypothetical protein